MLKRPLRHVDNPTLNDEDDVKHPAKSAQANVDALFGSDDTPLTLDDLPKPDTVRWVIRHKAKVVTAVKGGLLTFEEACDRYGLMPEELSSWQKTIENPSVAGLRKHE